jgi:hypothetical protein
MKYLFLIIAAFAVGHLAHTDEIELIDQMKSTCHQSYLVTSGPMEEACGTLIDRIEHNNKLEVMSDNLGNFWVESRD